MNKNKKKKLLIIDLGKAYGGMEKQVESLIVGLKDEFDISLAININGEFIKKSNCLKECKVLNINNGLKTFPKVILQIIKYVKQENIDIIHCNGTPANIIGIILKKLLNIKFISAVHSDIFYEFEGKKRTIYGFIEKITAKYANNVVVVSRDLQNKLRGRHKKYLDKFTVVYNGITFNDNSEGVQRVNNKGKFKILFVGRLVEIKNIEYLLNSIEKFKEFNNEFECNIIGEGELEEDLKKICKEKNIESYVNFLGFKSNVKEYMLQSDVLVMTSKMEGIPLVIIEAFANKLPVISSAVGGICEMIKNNHNGILFKLDNKDNLTNVFKDIFNNEYDLHKISKSAYKDYNHKWTREIMLKNYKEIYLN